MAEESLEGRENVYTCQKCGSILVTVDRDKGVTPFAIGCRQAPREGRGRHCTGVMHSSFYPKGPRPPHIPAPTHEWYNPVGEERERLMQRGGAEWTHVAKGGLLLRRIHESAALPAITEAGDGASRLGG